MSIFKSKSNKPLDDLKKYLNGRSIGELNPSELSNALNLLNNATKEQNK